MKILEPVELTDRQLKFVRHVAEGLAPSAAAVEAGWSVSYAPRLMRDPLIVTALQLYAVNVQKALRKVEERKPRGSAANQTQAVA